LAKAERYLFFFHAIAVLVNKVASSISLYFKLVLEISPSQSLGTIATPIPVLAHNNIARVSSILARILGSNPSCWHASTIIFSYLRCIITKKENVNLRIFLGILIAFIGVLFIISHGDLKSIFQQKTLFGDSLIIINALMWAWVTLRGKIVLNKYSPFVAMAYIHIFGTILLLPFAFFLLQWLKFLYVGNYRQLAGLPF
jgi:hypothetical protein